MVQDESGQLCFVVMPFSRTTDHHTDDYWTKHFEQFIKPLVEGNQKLEARRSKPLRGDILREIITYLVTAPVVVADLTDANPNVYWELGVRQSFKHGTVTIAEDGTRLPFDLGLKATHFYPNDHLKWEQFRTEFQEAIDDCLTHPNRPDSHVLEAISGRGTLYELIRLDEAKRRVDALASELKYNWGKYEKAVEGAKQNLEQRADRTRDATRLMYSTIRLRPTSVELLVATRYLEQDDSFFEYAEGYLDWLHMANEQLSLWPIHGENIEKWLVRTRDNGESIFRDFSAKLEDARRTLVSRL